MPSYRATNLKFRGYPGHIMLQKIRFGYGQQQHEEKMDILHNWYSDLNAYLPVISQDKKVGKTLDERINELLTDAAIRIGTMEQQYQPAFEGKVTCGPEEKAFRHTVRGVKEVLDIITAMSKVIDDAPASGEDEEVMAG